MASSDQGILLLRRLLLKQLDLIKAGEDPQGLSFDPSAAPVRFSAGNFLED